METEQLIPKMLYMGNPICLDTGNDGPKTYISPFQWKIDQKCIPAVLTVSLQQSAIMCNF